MRERIPCCSASRCATLADRCRPFAHVTIVRSVPSPTVRAVPTGTCSSRERRRPCLVSLLDGVARVVQRDRLEEDADAPVHERRLGARHEHRGGIVGPRRRGDDDAGDVPQHADRVVVVEMPSEAPLVAVASDPDHHPVPVRALGEELERRRLAAKLVLGVVEVREVLDLGDREESADRRTEREAEDRGLVEQRVEDPPRAESRMQPARHAVDPALDCDVLAEHESVRVPLEHRGEPGVDRLRQRQRLLRGESNPGRLLGDDRRASEVPAAPSPAPPRSSAEAPPPRARARAPRLVRPGSRRRAPLP